MFIESSRSVSIFLFALIILSLTGKIRAQLDPTFGTDGVVTASLGSEDTTLANFVLPDGKILVVAVADVNNQQKTFFVRYQNDGTIDSSYGTGGSVQLPLPFFTPARAEILAAARQPDGKIVVAGSDYFNSDQRPLVARFNENGTLDTTFADGNGISRPNISIFGDDQFNSVLVQPDGKILLAGGSESGGNPYLSQMRYHANGTIDPGFGTGGTGFIVHTSIGNQSLEAGEYLYLQTDGKIIVGRISQPNGFAIRRFNADGSIDNGFTTVIFNNSNEFQTAFVQPDDKILVGTRFTKTGPLERVHLEGRIARYHADGTPDAGFGDAGQVTVDVANYSADSPRGFQIMPDGQILVAFNVAISPNRTAYRGNWLGLARLSANGTVNGKFLAVPTGDHTTSFVTALPDGKVLAAVKGRTWSNADGVKLVRAVGVPLQIYRFHGIPLMFPAGGLLGPTTSLGVYRPGSNTYHFYNSTSVSGATAGGDVFAPADYIGNFNCDMTYFRPSTGTWHIARNFFGGTDVLTIRWGMAGDTPAPGDFDGDGKADPAVYRPSEGVWYIYHIADGSYRIRQWGANGDKPVVGDYDGDGIDDIAVFRPSTGEWWILRSSDDGYTLVQFGLEGDIPVQEDYDGDGKFDIAVYRPSTGVWYRINSSDVSFFAYQWGLAGDVPVPGNYDGDLKANVAVWRPSNGTWYVVNNDYVSMAPYLWGMNGDRPIPGKY